MEKKKEKNKVLSLLEKAEEIVLVSMFAFMVLIIFFQVIMRYAFNNSLSWSEEMGKFLFVWISWLGISIGAREDEHIRITMLTDRLTYKQKQIFNVITEIIVFGICLVTIYYGIILMRDQAHVIFAGMKISMSWGYLAVVAGCSIMLLRNIQSILRSISNYRRGYDQVEEIEK